MGWSGGTVIFDTVADEILKIYEESDDYHPPKYKILNLLSALNATLGDQDWDNQCESEYWNHEVIGSILGNTFEDEDET